MTTLDLDRPSRRSQPLTGVPIRWQLAPTLGRVRSEWTVELLVLLLVGVAFPVAVAVHYGSMGVPSADDWAYDLSAFHLAFHGGFDLYHFGPSNMVGQLIMAAPALWVFGPHIWVLNLWTCVCGFAGLVALDHLARTLGLSRRGALFCSLSLGLGPMWAALSTSFMLDIPAVSFMTIALAIAAADRRVDRLLTGRSALALAVAAISFTIRDESVIAVAAIAWCRMWRCGRPSVRAALPWVAGVAALAAGLLSFQIWRLALPTGGHGYPVEPPSLQWTSYQWLLPLAGVMMIPAAAAIRPYSLVREALRDSRGWVLLTWAVMPGLPLVAYSGRLLDQVQAYGLSPLSRILGVATPPFGNYYFMPTLYGPYRTRIYLLVLLTGLAVVSILATMVVEAASVMALRRWINRLREHRGAPSQASYAATMLGTVVAGSWGIFAVGIKWDLQAWDRYLLPIMAYVPMLVLYVRSKSVAPGPNRWSRRGAFAWLSVLALMGSAGTLAVDGLDAMAWNYSNDFAASVPNTPRGLIYTSWVWTSMQEHYMVSSDTTFNMLKSYSPCYLARLNSTPSQGDVYFRRGGSWVEPVSYAMMRVSDSPVCRFPD